MPYVTIDNFRLYYEEYGPRRSSGNIIPKAVVFLHGFTLDRRMWTPQVSYFSKNRRVIVVDARGHGLSDAPLTGYSRADRVYDFYNFTKSLSLERFHLVGLSMGGSTAIEYALSYAGQLQSLTLVSTGATGWDIGRKISRIDQLAREKGLEAARSKWMDIALSYYRDNQKDVRALVELMIREHSGAPWMDAKRGKYPPPPNDLERVHKIKLPTMIFAGSKDTIFLPLAYELGKRIPGSTVLEYPNVGHILNLEEPERFNSDLDNFLTRIENQT